MVRLREDCVSLGRGSDKRQGPKGRPTRFPKERSEWLTANWDLDLDLNLDLVDPDLDADTDANLPGLQ